MRLRLLLPALVLLAAPLGAVPAAAQQQQGQDWFVPGQQRPAQPAQRPAQTQQRPAAGQRPPAPIIAIVDIPEVQRLSAAFTQVREEIERRRARLNEDLQREQQRWRDEQQRLAAERGGLTPEQLRNRERELQDRITDSQRTLRDRAASIEQVAQAALREIEQALGVIIRQVATSRNVNIVLPRPLVIFNEPPFDLTEEIAVQLNRVLPTVNLPAEAAEAPAAPQQRPAQPPQQPRQGAAPQGQQRRN
jgi:Skp family chaperone for outer membrane proteins